MKNFGSTDFNITNRFSASPSTSELCRTTQLKDKFGYIFVDETSENLLKMNDLTDIGLKPLDALHIACAVSLQCQYFLTVDKGILKKTAKYSEIKIMNPIDFILEWEANQ